MFASEVYKKRPSEGHCLVRSSLERGLDSGSAEWRTDFRFQSALQLYTGKVYNETPSEGHYFVRSSLEKGKTWVWRNQWVDFRPYDAFYMYTARVYAVEESNSKRGEYVLPVHDPFFLLAGGDLRRCSFFNSTYVPDRVCLPMGWGGGFPVCRAFSEWDGLEREEVRLR